MLKGSKFGFLKPVGGRGWGGKGRAFGFRQLWISSQITRAPVLLALRWEAAPKTKEGGRKTHALLTAAHTPSPSPPFLGARGGDQRAGACLSACPPGVFIPILRPLCPPQPQQGWPAPSYWLALKLNQPGLNPSALHPRPGPTLGFSFGHEVSWTPRTSGSSQMPPPSSMHWHTTPGLPAWFPWCASSSVPIVPPCFRPPAHA